jgi:hypothetical protein
VNTKLSHSDPTPLFWIYSWQIISIHYNVFILQKQLEAAYKGSCCFYPTILWLLSSLYSRPNRLSALLRWNMKEARAQLAFCRKLHVIVKLHLEDDSYKLYLKLVWDHPYDITMTIYNWLIATVIDSCYNMEQVMKENRRQRNKFCKVSIK